MRALLRTIFDTFADALFPLHPAERWILETDADLAISSLPRAKCFSIREGCALFAYKDERAHRLIWSLKYKKSEKAAVIASRSLERMLRRFSLVAGPMIIIPMPISSQRRRERGFNQCELLTEKLKGSFAVHDKLLIRSHHTERQTLKDRAGRIDGARGLFQIDAAHAAILHERGLSNATFIIIDDVITTGSTMKEAVRSMKDAGFADTWGLAVAH